MTQHGFPIGDYTPFGYLSNYTQFARSWNEVYGGTLRSALDFPGFGWVYPTERRPAAGVAVGAMPIDLDQPLLEIEELDGARLHSPYHSANIFAYAWEHGNAPVEVRYFQTGDDALAGILSFPRGATARDVRRGRPPRLRRRARGPSLCRAGGRQAGHHLEAE